MNNTSPVGYPLSISVVLEEAKEDERKLREFEKSHAQPTESEPMCACGCTRAEHHGPVQPCDGGHACGTYWPPTPSPTEMDEDGEDARLEESNRLYIEHERNAGRMAQPTESEDDDSPHGYHEAGDYP